MTNYEEDEAKVWRRQARDEVERPDPSEYRDLEFGFHVTGAEGDPIPTPSDDGSIGSMTEDEYQEFLETPIGQMLVIIDDEAPTP